jgi:hypothetical protein
MSRTTSIRLYSPVFRQLTFPEIIEMYISNGWNLNDYGHISLRPLGDKDNFDWIELKLDQIDDLYRILRKKVDNDEDPAVVLMLDNIEISAVTTFFPKEGTIWFHFLGNLKEHPVYPEWTDISWYIPYLLKPLSANGISIEQIESSDYFD